MIHSPGHLVTWSHDHLVIWSGESRFNPIERYFGYLSRARSGALGLFSPVHQSCQPPPFPPGMMLPMEILDEVEQKREDLTETEKIYTQAMRMMLEKDNSLTGLNNIPITCGTVKMEKEDTVLVGEREYSINQVEKKDFEEVRKVITSNTLKQNLQKKSPSLAKSVTKAARHTELRKHCLIIRRCHPKLDGRNKVCSSCRKRPHSLPPQVVNDLPLRSMGGGARFWDVSHSDQHPGEQ